MHGMSDKKNVLHFTQSHNLSDFFI